MRPPVIINIHQILYAWTIFVRFHEFVSLCQLLQMQMLLLKSKGLCRIGAYFLIGVQIDPSEARGEFKGTK